VIRFAPRTLKSLAVKILSSYESGPVHFNFQIAEIRVSVKDAAGAARCEGDRRDAVDAAGGKPADREEREVR
jgi:hypothetical protein